MYVIFYKIKSISSSSPTHYYIGVLLATQVCHEIQQATGIESVTLRIQTETKEEQLIVTFLYHPPPATNQNQMSIFSMKVKNIAQPNRKNVVWFGVDLNLSDTHWDANSFQGNRSQHIVNHIILNKINNLGQHYANQEPNRNLERCYSRHVPDQQIKPHYKNQCHPRPGQSGQYP